MNGLEALRSIRPCANVCGDYDPYCDIIEKELKDGERSKKALEIIKEKQVRFPRFMMCSDFHSYNRPYLPKYKLTKDEFDFLKEVMK